MPSGVCHINTILCLKWLQKLTSCFWHSKTRCFSQGRTKETRQTFYYFIMGWRDREWPLSRLSQGLFGPWAGQLPAPCFQHWPWEDHATPLREEHSYPEKPISAPDARHLSTDIQMQAWSFPGQWPGRVSTQVFMSYCTEDLVRCKWFHCRNTLSSKHNQCRQDLLKSESTM